MKNYSVEQFFKYTNNSSRGLENEYNEQTSLVESSGKALVPVIF